MSESASPESTVIKEWLKEDANCWMAIACAFLRRYERDIAVERLSLALQYQLRDGPPKPTTLGGLIYKAGMTKIDYHALAVALASATEAAEPSLCKAMTA
jgi:hypothetical protein